jgi:hypothetical protein
MLELKNVCKSFGDVGFMLEIIEKNLCQRWCKPTTSVFPGVWCRWNKGEKELYMDFILANVSGFTPYRRLKSASLASNDFFPCPI